MNKSRRLYIICLLIAIVVKSVFFVYKISDFSHENNIYKDIIGLEGGDTISYIPPIDNFIETGSYFDDHRMPGYGFFYLIFRLILTKTFALNALLIFQLIIDSISVVVLAKISNLFSNSKTVFFITFSVYCLSTFVSVFDVFILSEVLCTSFLIFSIYFLLKPTNNSYINYFFSGLFLTGSVFMRPIMAPLFILFLIYILIVFFKNSNWYKFKLCFIFLLSFIIIDGSWILRNYNIYNKIIPLQKSVYYSGDEKTYLISLSYFLNAYGGSTVFWNPKSEITFYMPFAIGNSVAEVPPPSYIYTSKFNYDSLLILKNEIHKIDSLGKYTKSAEEINQTVILKLNRYTESIKTEKPFLYYVTSRFRVLSNFLIHSGTYNLFDKSSDHLNIFEFGLKIFYSLLYCGVIIFSLLGALYFLFLRFNNKKLVVVIITAAYLVLIYPFVFKMDEYRYLVTAYPFLLLISIFFSYTIFNFLKKFKNQNIF